ncbi:MAG: metal-dependent hydrolase [Candidatus Bathyarchaeota archaeon]|nr:metal-dependent hydrolase [Candidatus Bathyarchaeota archaeon]
MKTKLNIPLVLTLSVIPDIDIFLSSFVEHRGPTHSLIMALIAFIPIFAVYHKKATPYLIALIQHSLVGDYVTGPTQLLWPITTQSYGIGIDIVTQTNVTIELLIFLAATVIMVKTRDAATLLQPHKSNLNLTLSIPTFTALLPTFISFPSYVPPLLIVPHLVYIFIFSASIIIDLRKVLKKRALRNSNKLTKS